MDAVTLLGEVAAAYRGLTSLAVEMRSIQGDEDRKQERRVLGAYVAPDRFRVDDGGKYGHSVVTNGLESASYSRRMKRFRRYPLAARDQTSCIFRPDYPAGVAFLFERISESVTRAEFMREESVRLGDAELLCMWCEWSTSRRRGFLRFPRRVLLNFGFILSPRWFCARNVKSR